MQNNAKRFFWRTTRQQEIDYIEVQNQTLAAYEFKWKSKKNVKIPKTFTNAYDATTQVIDHHNFREFLMD